MSSPKSALLIAALLCLTGTLSAQQPAAHSAANNAVNNDFVQKQFGSTCSMIGLAPFKGDLNNDGIEDIVIPARCTNPMMDQAENNFEVIDPFNSYHGYGNPKVTTRFASEDPDRRGYSLLVIHGAGPEAWHSDTPKAKFVIVNLPFREITIKKLMLTKKKPILGIYTVETGGDAITSVTFWDGKRYRYEPLGASME